MSGQDEAGFTPQDIADLLNEDGIPATAKDVRRVLRRMTNDRAGKGGSWALTEAHVRAVCAEFKSSTAAGRKARRVTPVLRAEFGQDDQS